MPNGKKTGYTPNFLIDENEWQELKGWENSSELKKWELFQQQYPEEKLVLITRGHCILNVAFGFYSKYCYPNSIEFKRSIIN